MSRLPPRYLRYGLGSFVLFWFVAGQMSIFVFLYTILATQIGALPQLSQSVFGLVLMLTVVGTLLVGYLKFGSILEFLVRVISLIASDDEEETLVEGRILGDDFAWRVRYLSGNRVIVDCRECPRCGQEVIERHLPNDIVYGPNTGFNPSSELRTTTDEIWLNVTGKEKAEDNRETQALTCPSCNVSAPGAKEILEGEDAIRAKFKSHIQEMKKLNPKHSPFASYEELAKDGGISNPMPADIWDAYVQRTNSDDVLPVQQHEGQQDSEPIRQPIEA